MPYNPFVPFQDEYDQEGSVRLQDPDYSRMHSTLQRLGIDPAEVLGRNRPPPDPAERMNRTRERLGLPRTESRELGAMVPQMPHPAARDSLAAHPTYLEEHLGMQPGAGRQPTALGQLEPGASYQDEDGFWRSAGRELVRSMHFWEEGITARERTFRLLNVGSLALPAGFAARIPGVMRLFPTLRAVTTSKKGQIAVGAAGEGLLAGGLEAVRGPDPETGQSHVVTQTVFGATFGGLLAWGFGSATKLSRMAYSKQLAEDVADFTRVASPESPLYNANYAVIYPGAGNNRATRTRLLAEMEAEAIRLGHGPIPVRTKGAAGVMLPGVDEATAIALARRSGASEVLTKDGLVDLDLGLRYPMDRTTTNFGQAARLDTDLGMVLETGKGDVYWKPGFDMENPVRLGDTGPVGKAIDRIEANIDRDHTRSWPVRGWESFKNLNMGPVLSSWYQSAVRAVHSIGLVDKKLGFDSSTMSAARSIEKQAEMLKDRYAIDLELMVQHGVPSRGGLRAAADGTPEVTFLEDGLLPIWEKNLRPEEMRPFEHYGFARYFLSIAEEHGPEALPRRGGRPILSVEDAQAIVAEAPEHFSRTFDRTRSWENAVLRTTLLDSGRITPETFRRLTRRIAPDGEDLGPRDYIPLVRLDKADAILQDPQAPQFFAAWSPLSRIAREGKEGPLASWQEELIKRAALYARVADNQRMANALIERGLEGVAGAPALLRATQKEASSFLDGLAQRLYPDDASMRAVTKEATMQLARGDDAGVRTALQKLGWTDDAITEYVQRLESAVAEDLATSGFATRGLTAANRAALERLGLKHVEGPPERVLEENREILKRMKDSDPALLRALQGEPMVEMRRPTTEQLTKLKEALAGGPLARVSKDGTITLNAEAIRLDYEAGMPYIRGLIDSPTSAQKKAVFQDVDIQRLHRELGSAERYSEFIEAHERAHLGLPRYDTSDLLGPEAIRIEREANNIALRELGIEPGTLIRMDDAGVADIFRAPIQSAGDDGIYMSRIVDGRAEWWQVTDPQLWDAIKSFGPMEYGLMDRIVKVASVPAGLLRSTVVLGFGFQAKSIIRDPLFAFVNAGLSPLAAVRGAASLWKQDKFYEAWKVGGGPRAALLSLDQPTIHNTLQDLHKTQQTTGRRLANTLVRPQDWYRALRSFGEAIENAPRLGAFRKEFTNRVRAGQLPDEAVWDAALASKQVSVNFSMHGAHQGAAFFRATTTFWNAIVQGGDQIIRSANKDPRGFLGRGALLTAASVALYGLNRKDEDYTYGITPWEKNLFWHFRMPENAPLAAGEWIRVPKPFEPGIMFGSLPERFMEALDADDPTVLDEGFLQAAQMTGGAFVPVPTILQPVLENWRNERFLTGAPIVPESQADIAAQFQDTGRTSHLARGLARMINQGRDPEDARVSPLMIDNLFEGVTGELGSLVYRDIPAAMLDGYRVNIQGQDPEPRAALRRGGRSIPGLSTFYSSFPYSSQPVADLYTIGEKARKAATTAHYLQESFRVDMHADYVMERAEYIQLSGAIQNRIDELARLRDRRDQIIAAQDLTPGQKNAAIRDITEQMTKVARPMMETLRAGGIR